MPDRAILTHVHDGVVPPDRAHLRHWPARLPRSLTLPDTSLWVNLEVSAQRYPAKAATLFFGRIKTYSELRREAQALAAWLQAEGVARGDRVVLFMQNCPQFVVALHAVLRADAVVVPANPMNRAAEFAHYITDARPRVIICDRARADVAAAAQAALPPGDRARRIVVTDPSDELPEGLDREAMPAAAADLPLPADAVRWADALATAAQPRAHASGPDDLAYLGYTSGTTGRPKGCMHTHRSLMANVVGGTLWGASTADSVVLGVIPMFHVTGMLYGVLAPAYTGASVVVLPRWDREQAAAAIAHWRVTHWTCVPTMIIDLLASPRADAYDLSSLRHLSGGGAAMPHAVAARLRDEFGLVFCEGYGLTETAAPSHGNPVERAKLQCLGMPFFGVDSRVVDPHTLAEVATGETGEIVTRGPMLFHGYWGHPQATRDAFVELAGQPGPRYFRTGDLGRVDEDGYFFMTDRLKRMINASGYKVWPAEVESLLYQHPAVQEACVIAAHDPYRGQTVKALVVLREDWRGRVTPQDIADWAHDHMAPYKAPRRVAFVGALPRSGAGKVLWRELQEREDADASGDPCSP